MLGWSIGFDPVRKRFCRADRTFRPGEVVLSEEAFAAVLSDEQSSKHCHHTFTTNRDLLRCGGCRFARYASKEGQKAAWSSGHKEECAALRACAPRIPPATVRLAAHVYWKQQRLSNGINALPESIETLEHHWEDLNDDRKQSFAQMAVVTKAYMQGSGCSKLPDVKNIAYLLARFACNNHTICDDELRPIGVGVYPQGAMLNHSCTPNTMQSFRGSRIVFQALQPIPAGAEATIAYVELAATRAERRSTLLANYFFDIDAGQEQPAPAEEVTLDGRVRLQLFRAAPSAMDDHDQQLTAVNHTPGSGANAIDVHKSPPFCSEPEDEVYEAGISQTSELRRDWDVEVQCWGPAFWQGGANITEAQTVAAALAVAVHMHASANNLVSEGRAAEACTLTASALQSLGARLQTHIWRMRILEVRLRAAIDLGNAWELALETARELLIFYHWLYPKVWPNLGLHLAMLAKIAALLEQNHEAASHAEAAASILRITHPDGQALQEMLQLWHDANAELSANAEE